MGGYCSKPVHLERNAIVAEAPRPSGNVGYYLPIILNGKKVDVVHPIDDPSKYVVGKQVDVWVDESGQPWTVAGTRRVWKSLKGRTLIGSGACKSGDMATTILQVGLGITCVVLAGLTMYGTMTFLSSVVALCLVSSLLAAAYTPIKTYFAKNVYDEHKVAVVS